MQQTFRSLSISYKKAPVEVRERFSLDESGCRSMLVKAREVLDIPELLIVSTCNRTEVYYTAEQSHAHELIHLIGMTKGIVDPMTYLPYFELVDEHEEAIRRLFYVGIGLESQVVGDLQITGQVKKAYQYTADAGMAGPFLHRLLHTIFFASKRVVQETVFRDGAASVSYAAVELVQELTAGFVQPEVLVLGLGEIGTDVVRNLCETDVTNITLINRTREKADKLAAECGGLRVAPFEEAWQHISRAQVIISSLALAEPFITRQQVAGMGDLHLKCFLDLSVPRSIERAVEDIPGVLVYDVDTIHNRATEALERRRAAIPQVERIIAEAMAEFQDWSKEMIFSPAIQKFKNALEKIRQEEMSKASRQLSEEEWQKFDTLTRNLMQKIIKLPVVQLKAACRRGEAETLVEVLHDLFNLEKETQAAERR